MSFGICLFFSMDEDRFLSSSQCQLEGLEIFQELNIFQNVEEVSFIL